MKQSRGSERQHRCCQITHQAETKGRCGVYPWFMIGENSSGEWEYNFYNLRNYQNETNLQYFNKLYFENKGGTGRDDRW